MLGRRPQDACQLLCLPSAAPVESRLAQGEGGTSARSRIRLPELPAPSPRCADVWAHHHAARAAGAPAVSPPCAAHAHAVHHSHGPARTLLNELAVPDMQSGNAQWLISLSFSLCCCDARSHLRPHPHPHPLRPCRPCSVEYHPFKTPHRFPTAPGRRAQRLCRWAGAAAARGLRASMGWRLLARCARWRPTLALSNPWNPAAPRAGACSTCSPRLPSRWTRTTQSQVRLAPSTNAAPRLTALPWPAAWTALDQCSWWGMLFFCCAAGIL